MQPLESLKPILTLLADDQPLSQEQAYAAIDYLMAGKASPVQAAALLMGLRARGETVEELTGAVQAMRAHMVRVHAPETAIDIVGTGGDNAGTFNISTAAAFVVAAAGVPMAKHGNRAFSSQSGAADVLQALGVNINVPVATMEAAIANVGIGFLFAPNHHPAIAHVQPIRAELGVRTIFNLLGPMCNPAGVQRQVTGVYDAKWLEPMARALIANGAQHVWLVYNTIGLDELAPLGTNLVVEATPNGLQHLSLSAANVGLPTCTLADLRGGDAAQNAAAMRAIFSGTQNAYANAVAFNAGAGLVVAGKAGTIADGVRQAHAILHSGKTLAIVDKLASFSQNAS